MLVVGIAGGTGSGKTTVVKKIIDQLPQAQVTVIPQDSYYKDSSHIPMEERKQINFDHPDSIEFDLIVEQLELLKQGNSVQQPTYSYLTCTRQEEVVEVNPSKIIILEGILILSNKRLRDLMDLKIFVDADADDRLSRVISRDIVERGRDVEAVLSRYKKTVKPSHTQFIEPTKSFADIIVPQGGNNTVAINMLKEFLQQNIEKYS